MELKRRTWISLLALISIPTLLVEQVGRALGEQVDRGAAAPGAFGLLVGLYCVLVVPALNRVEGLVFATTRRPWLGGRLKRWQRLLLPYWTARVVTLGVSWGFGGGAYLITAPPGGSAVNVAAVLFSVCGGALVGFGVSRLFVGLFVIRYSGLWAASKRSWLIGGGAITCVSLVFAADSVRTIAELSSVL